MNPVDFFGSIQSISQKFSGRLCVCRQILRYCLFPEIVPLRAS